MLKLSEEEARALVGPLEEGPLSDLGVPEVVVTLGSRGAIVVAEGRLVHVPAEPVDADPTGAGDAFAAAYVVERSQGQEPRRAAVCDARTQSLNSSMHTPSSFAPAKSGPTGLAISVVIPPLRESTATRPRV